MNNRSCASFIMNRCGYEVGKIQLRLMSLAFDFIHQAYVYELISGLITLDMWGGTCRRDISSIQLVIIYARNCSIRGRKCPDLSLRSLVLCYARS